MKLLMLALTLTLALAMQSQACLVFWATSSISNRYEAHLIDNGVEVCSAKGKSADDNIVLECTGNANAQVKKHGEIVIYEAAGKKYTFGYRIHYDVLSSKWWANNYDCHCSGFKCESAREEGAGGEPN